MTFSFQLLLLYEIATVQIMNYSIEYEITFLWIERFFVSLCVVPLSGFVLWIHFILTSNELRHCEINCRLLSFEFRFTRFLLPLHSAAEGNRRQCKRRKQLNGTKLINNSFCVFIFDVLSEWVAQFELGVKHMNTYAIHSRTDRPIQ